MQEISKELATNMLAKENSLSKRNKPLTEIRGGQQAYCIGNGQLHDALVPEEVCKTLNCMCDPMKILIVGDCNDDV